MWRPTRRLSRVLVVLCSVATSKAFITCTFSMQCFDRPARRVSRALFVLCTVATSKAFITCTGCSIQCGDQKAFITCNCSFYAIWRPARRLSRVVVRSMQYGDQQGVYHTYFFSAVSRSTSKACITCTGRSVVSRLTRKTFITCTCSMQCLDQNVFSSHVLFVVSADSVPVRCLPLAHVALYSFSISKALATCTGRLLLCAASFGNTVDGDCSRYSIQTNKRSVSLAPPLSVCIVVEFLGKI